MFKKIHFGYSLIFILLLSVVPLTLFLFTFLGEMGTNQVVAGGIPGAGLLITKPPMKCIMDVNPLSPYFQRCPNCPTCGDILVGTCGTVFEIGAKFLSGSDLLNMGAGGPALCVMENKPSNGGTFRPGAQCLGQYLNTAGLHKLSNFGCSL